MQTSLPPLELTPLALHKLEILVGAYKQREAEREKFLVIASQQRRLTELLSQTSPALNTFQQSCTSFGADNNLTALILNMGDTPIVHLRSESGRLGQSFN
jgi:hypothetical protein